MWAHEVRHRASRSPSVEAEPGKASSHRMSDYMAWALSHLTLRFTGQRGVYESQLQLSRWNSPIVEICICGLLAPSLAAATDADASTAYLHWSIFLLESLLAAVAISRRFCMYENLLLGKQIFEGTIAFTIVAGLCGYAMSTYSTVTTEPTAAFVCDKSFRFRFGPMAHSMMVTIAVILSHVLHMHPLVKLLISLSFPVFTIIRPIFPFGLEPELQFVSIATLAGYVFGYALESQLRENFVTQRASRDAIVAQRRADSRLNHVVKGLCGGASGLLLGLQVELEQQGPQANTSESLDEVRRMLDEATEWVHKRQFFVQLEAGEYISRAVQSNLREKMEVLLGHDGVFDGVAEVCVDMNVTQLVAQEALSNARKYRDRNVPILITAHVEHSKDKQANLLLTISSTNRAGVHRLSATECREVFKPGFKANSVSPTSDGLGLDNASVAVRAAHGRVWLTTTTDRDGDHTHLHCELPVTEVLPARSPISVLHQEMCKPPLKPANAQHRLKVSGALAKECQRPAAAAGKKAPNVKCLDSTPASPTVGAVARRQPPLICLGLDDTPMLRKMHMLLFKLFLEADMDRSGTLGATRSEIIAFVDVAMGRLDLSMKPGKLKPADVVIIDQNLCDDEDDDCIRGEEIALRLREEKFAGVICILTGSNLEEIDRLSGLPHIDLAFEKSIDLRTLTRHITEKMASSTSSTPHQKTFETMDDGASNLR